MKLVVGLGNPGPQYRDTPHNLGFRVADVLAVRWRVETNWRVDWESMWVKSGPGPSAVLLLKPQTYMNDSGRSVQAAAAFYKLSLADTVVFHDEVDLPPGKTRMKTGGGAAGHNGLRSIDAALGDGYRRVRIGVGHPGVKEAVPHYVLHDFAKADQEWLKPLLEAIADNAPLLAEGKDPTFANRLHAATKPEPPPEKKAKPAKDLGGPSESKSEAPQASREVERPREGPLAGALRKLFRG